MAHLSYEEAKKTAFKGFVLLGIVTVVEVLIALLGKGYIIEGFHLPRAIMYLAMIILSLYKAYFIVYEFMHMRYEVPGLVKSVLLPTLLLVWAIIAFFSEGHTWNVWRANIHDRPTLTLEKMQMHHKDPQDAHQVKETPMAHDTMQHKSDTTSTEKMEH
ncbi:MAG: cytochrome C oxidase subunit IV family protein [Saprospiraceae bacterium]|nr:cytochrome C oxidase subunit IV family protein [Saprospiraceae bacterium]